MKRVFTSVMGLVLAAGSLGLVGAVGAGAAAAPTMTVTPSTGLTSNQEVVVTGSGYTPNATYAAVECIGTATTTAGCNTNAIAPVSVSATGTVSFNFYVQTGPIGNGTCGTSAADSTCLIVIGTLTGTQIAYAPISFGAPAPAGPSITLTPSTGLASGAKVTITGSGFTAGDSLFAVECLATATSSADCNTAGATPITVNSDGTLPSTSFTVTTGTIGSGACGTTAANAAGCVISVSTAAGGDAAHASITFAVAVPTITVSPATGLKNGAKVTITGSGFTAGDSLFAVQCLASATSAAGCNTAGATPITANSDGTLPSTTFTVATGTIGSGVCGTKAANAKNCVITVATITGTDAGAAPIQFAVAAARLVPVLFARPSVNLRNHQVVTVFGHGFKPRDHVFIVECLVGARGPAGCDLRTVTPVVIRPNGVLPATKFHVVTGKVGRGVCGTTRANLHACTISVANIARGDSKVLRIAFRLP